MNVQNLVLWGGAALAVGFIVYSVTNSSAGTPVQVAPTTSPASNTIATAAETAILGIAGQTATQLFPDVLGDSAAPTNP